MVLYQLNQPLAVPVWVPTAKGRSFPHCKQLRQSRLMTHGTSPHLNIKLEKRTASPRARSLRKPENQFYSDDHLISTYFDNYFHNYFDNYQQIDEFQLSMDQQETDESDKSIQIQISTRRSNKIGQKSDSMLSHSGAPRAISTFLVVPFGSANQVTELPWTRTGKQPVWQVLCYVEVWMASTESTVSSRTSSAQWRMLSETCDWPVWIFEGNPG